jgi:hypothetical protein
MTCACVTQVTSANSVRVKHMRYLNNRRMSKEKMLCECDSNKAKCGLVVMLRLTFKANASASLIGGTSRANMS